ncbi:peptidase dimerization domain-containing protein [Salinibacter ruber]|uniref:peptidase dimerization domain-containing protein n=1 Tax=Salinibacter ruber TaxID=146919 RepID=UPI00311A9421
MNQFYQLSGRITDPRTPSVLTVTMLDGSEAHNVIPEQAALGGTLRTVSPDDRETIRTHMREIANRMESLRQGTRGVGLRGRIPSCDPTTRPPSRTWKPPSEIHSGRRRSTRSRSQAWAEKTLPTT